MLDIYVDGSYKKDISKKAGWAFIVVEDDKLIHQEYGLTEHDAKSWNIDGELEAALRAIKWANGRKIRLFHDYNGVEYFSICKWKAKSKAARHYQKSVLSIGGIPNVDFIKVKSHSGNHWNDVVDNLASVEVV
jgi:ribonuclease HI